MISRPLRLQKKYINGKTKKVLDDSPLPRNATVRYLYTPGELEGGVRRSTDPVWSITTHQIHDMISSAHRQTYYKLDPTAPHRSFTREKLQVIPEDTQLPPMNLA